MVGTSLSILQDHIEFAEMNRPVRAFTTAERLASLRRRLGPDDVAISVAVVDHQSSKTAFDSMMLCLMKHHPSSCGSMKKAF